MAASDRPELDPARAAELLRERWGLEGELQALGSYADLNFALRLADGTRRLIKLSGARSEAPEVVDMQLAALAHLAEGPAASLVQRVIPTHDGQDFISIDDGRGEPCSLRVLSWLEGELWSERDHPSPQLRRSLGRALARLDLALADFEHPAMHRSLRWNLAEADWIAEQLGALADERRRALVIGALAQYRARVRPRLVELPVQLIHGDANDQNLIIAGDELVGLIDLGDAVAAPAICDLAVALAYAAMVEDPLAACAEVCAGYHELRPLSAAELELIYDLVRARLAVSVVSSALAHAREPDNAYVTASEAPAWTSLGKLTEFGRGALTRTIGLACGLPRTPRVPSPRSKTQLLAQRRVRLGPSLSLAYDEPLYIRRGEGCWLFDEHEQGYLDCVNNVAHVGHAEPRVRAATLRQAALLNTNTRYLHEGILSYAERLCATLPRSLSVVYLVNSGSEANDLALRLARAHTRGRDVVVVDGAYHGHTTTLIDVSPYKFDGPGGVGKPAWVHVLDTPDPYRGRHGDEGPAYAAPLESAANLSRSRGASLSAFICESVLGCAGQIVPAPGFLAAAYRLARDAGAVCIADEVQIGFGRVGEGMWAFEAEGVVPDILTLGKPIGNGHPMGAVVTTREIAASFANGMEYFNTFGGNPVSCAVGSAVLEVIEADGLMQHAQTTGAALMHGLRELDDAGVGEVRGRGLFIGVELVSDRARKTPDPRRAKAVVEYARGRGVLLSTDGPHHNVIKIKPPMCFAAVEARLLVETLRLALRASA